MESREEGLLLLEPVSPTAQYMNSSVLSLAILAVLELQVPFNHSLTLPLLKQLFLPINPRFSSIMVEDVDGKNKLWKRVEVKLEDHIHVPVFPSEMSLESYDNYLDEYITKIAAETFPQCRPLWEVHFFKYPTSQAAEHIIFKIHHAIGDGYSLMGALLSCLQNAHNPSLPITFPSLKGSNSETGGLLPRVFEFVPEVLSSVFYTAWDFSSSIFKGSGVEDDRTPIRSGIDGVEFRPMSVSTLTLSIEEMKLIKNKLGVTINDVLAGTIFLGTRMYMQEMNNEKSSNQNCTALVLLNTRLAASYKSVQEMLVEMNKSWGNQFGFLPVSVPKSNELSKPLDFVWEAHNIIKRHRSSSAWYLTSRLWDILKKLRGPEAGARHIHSTLKNSSMAITNMIGPIEQMALANHPIDGIYFMVVGSPQIGLMEGTDGVPIHRTFHQDPIPKHKIIISGTHPKTSSRARSKPSSRSEKQTNIPPLDLEGCAQTTIRQRDVIECRHGTHPTGSTLTDLVGINGEGDLYPNWTQHLLTSFIFQALMARVWKEEQRALHLLNLFLHSTSD